MVADRPFSLISACRSDLRGRITSIGARCIERFAALHDLNSVYAKVAIAPSGVPFCERVLHALRIEVDVESADLKTVPRSGALVAIANHPFGGLDGLILLALLLRVRPDVRILANHLLWRIPELREHGIFVDPFGTPAASQRNRGAVRAALHWVRSGGALVMFPAGEVSSLSLRRLAVADPPWPAAAVRMIQRASAPVVPIRFDGGNSGAFQLAGLVHPRLRTALLPREFLRMEGRCVRVEIGSVITAARIAHVAARGDSAERRPGSQRLGDYLRMRIDLLRSRRRPHAVPGSLERARAQHAAAQAPLAPRGPVAEMVREVEALPPEQVLVASGPWLSAYATAAQVPALLLEIGRRRELTFRQAGEGTGKALDLDRFDEHYLHLFVWNRETLEIAGAYRLGQADVLLGRFGAAGLYTHTLFQFGPQLLRQLDPALELGRSFVAPEYQKNYAPLLLLWRGIGRYVARYPRYRRLFGAVSISDNYHTTTKQLLMAFLNAHCLDRELAAHVTPRNPPRYLRQDDAGLRAAAVVGDLDEVDELVNEIETHRRGLPVLLRHYLKLDAKLLGFNVDPNFGDVLDGLVLVDLAQAPRAVLQRYMGAREAESFLASCNAALGQAHPATGVNPKADGFAGGSRLPSPG